MRALPLLLSAALLTAIPAQGDPQDQRRELVRRINAERSRAGSPPLNLDEPLTRAAQQHAEQISRRGELRSGSGEDTKQHLARAGYEAHEWTEYLTATSSGPGEILRSWQERDPATFRSLLNPAYRDLGLGISHLRGTPLYTFLFAVPQADYFQRETADLRDLEEVRADVLVQINAARKRQGLVPLRSSPPLDRASQRHAEDMLARGYFEHRSPEGDTVRERATAAGYAWRAIGENIAFGQTSADEVVEKWLASPAHRRNILNPDFAEMGLGLALGRSPQGKYQVLWVQSFGARR